MLNVPVSIQSPESLGLELFQLKCSLNKSSIFCRNEIGVSPGSAGWRREQRALNAPSTKFPPTLPFLTFLGFYKKSQLFSHSPAETYFSFICSAKAIATLPVACFPPKICWHFLYTVVFFPVVLFLVSLFYFLFSYYHYFLF